MPRPTGEQVGVTATFSAGEKKRPEPKPGRKRPLDHGYVAVKSCRTGAANMGAENPTVNSVSR